MSTIVEIQSTSQLSSLVQSSTIVAMDFWAPWCGPCKAIAPLYEQLAASLSRPGKITFTMVNTDEQQQIAKSYSVSAMPTFIILKNGREINRIRGADGRQLQEAVKKLANEAETVDKNPEAASSSSGPLWYGAGLPKGYADVTDQVEIKGLELLNADPAYGGAKTLFDNSKPSGIANADGKGKGRADSSQQTTKDWVESDTDEQLMLYIPFMSSVKIHTLLLTSLPPSEDDDPMRPRTIRLFTNSAHNLGFEEAEDMTPTQGIELAPESFDKATGTAKVELRFVKFAKCSSLVLFVVNGEGDGEKVRIDRLRVIGESGVSREMGKLEKIGDAPGE